MGIAGNFMVDKDVGIASPASESLLSASSSRPSQPATKLGAELPWPRQSSSVILFELGCPKADQARNMIL